MKLNEAREIIENAIVGNEFDGKGTIDEITDEFYAVFQGVDGKYAKFMGSAEKANSSGTEMTFLFEDVAYAKIRVRTAKAPKNRGCDRLVSSIEINLIGFGPETDIYEIPDRIKGDLDRKRFYSAEGLAERIESALTATYEEWTYGD